MNIRNLITGVLLITAFAFTSQNASAQESKGSDLTPTQQAANLTEKMRTELNLNETQLVSVRKLNVEFANRKEAAKESGDKDAIQTAKAEHERALENILDASQMEKYRNMKKHHLKGEGMKKAPAQRQNSPQ